MKIAVIGAGPSGLAVSKELSEFDHDVVVFESTGEIGGVFAHSYKGLRLVNNNVIIAFGSFLEGLSATDLYMWDAADYLEYLQRYAQHFDLYPKIRLHAPVSKIRSEGQAWLVHYEVDGAESEERFDYVVVCTGGTPNHPSFPNQERFSGEILHGGEISEPSALAGKRVVIVGTGEYGADLSYLVGQHASSLVISQRRWPSYMIPRYHDGQPTDLDTTRLYHGLPPGVEQSWLAPLIKLKRSLEFSRITSPSDRATQEVADQLNARCPDFGVFQRITAKTESLARAIIEFGVELKPGVVDFDGDRVVFADGSSVTCDVVINCTGFRPSFSFLEPALAAKGEDVRGLAYYMLPFAEEGIAFVGFVRPGVGSIPPMAEMQARYLALLLSGKRAKPSGAKMRRVIAEQRARDSIQYPADADRLTGLTDFYRFLSTMAREIGCEPSTISLLLRSPKTFYKLHCACLCAAQYRLVGPGASPEHAERIIRGLPTVPPSILAIELMLRMGASLHTLGASASMPHFFPFNHSKV